MAETSPARKRVALAFVAIGIVLIVQRTLALAGAADVVPPAQRESRRAAATASSAPPDRASDAPETLQLQRLSQPAPRPAASGNANSAPLFAVQSWQPPPPPPPMRAERAEPQAPSFPYAYMGGLSDDRGRTAFFNRGDRVLSVRAGETVDGSFRVDQLDETSMTVTYVPLNKSMQMALGASR